MEQIPGILIVEDEPITALDIKGILEQSGYRVVGIAETGERALEIVRTEPPDLILMDIILGGTMNGIELATAIKERHRIPIIYITSLSDASTFARTLSTDPYGYITKPLDTTMLTHMIDLALYKQRIAATLHESEARFRAIIDQLPLAVSLYTPDGVLTDVNTAWETIWGLDPQEQIGRFNIRNHEPVISRGLQNYIDEAFRGESVIIPEMTVERPPDRPGGAPRPMILRCRAFPILEKGGAIQSIVFLHEDITERKQAEEQALYYSMFDNLTGLPNREVFATRLHTEIMKSKRRGNEYIFGVMCLGTDRFKNINEMHGPVTGDKLLKEIAKRLKTTFRADDLVARLEGDKFIVLLSDIKTADDISSIVRKTEDAFRAPLTAAGMELTVSMTIGVCLYPNDGDKAEALIKNSEAALYMAKQRGTGTYHLYDHTMHEQTIHNLRLEKDLVIAIDNQEFRAFYQPKVNREGAIVGMESLIRWQSPARGLVPPLHFIPLAEKNGLIKDIGYIIMYESCRQTKEWQTMGLPPLKVAVNLSSFQFRQPCLIDKIKEILSVTGLDPQWLEFEITESGIMENEKESIGKLNEINALGVSISIDDFGTGYSSLSKLKSLPIDTIKIDKSFVDDLPHDATSVNIATTIIDLAHNLGFKVVAEGVETKEQIDFLLYLGCDQFQGYYYSKPLPSDEFRKKLSTA